MFFYYYYSYLLNYFIFMKYFIYFYNRCCNYTNFPTIVNFVVVVVYNLNFITNTVDIVYY